MENKYYTPKIEEFFVGFEYEAYNSREWFFREASDGWVKMNWEPRQLSNNQGFFNIDGAIQKEWIRVKYLDTTDIESCGWKQQVSIEGKTRFTLSTGTILKDTKENRWELIYYEESKKLQINQGTHWPRFFGDIKNKSELKKLMQQLGI